MGLLPEKSTKKKKVHSSSPEVHHEIVEAFRPKKFEDVYGQDEAVSILNGMVAANKIPHALLFTGPSGCGKTTLARILRRKIGCDVNDFVEINSADCRGIDTIREIRSKMHSSPLRGKNRVWLLDECHNLTRDAQTAVLKVLEDGPSHVYFILCTTEPIKLLRTVITRCTEIKIKGLTDATLAKLLTDVATKMKFSVSDDVVNRIIEVAEGSARKALKVLEQVTFVDDESERLDIVQSSDARQEAIELCRLLIKGASWKEVASVLKKIEDEPEGVRHLMLSYASSVCLSCGPLYKRAALILDCFRESVFYTKKAGLVMAAFECCHQ